MNNQCCGSQLYHTGICCNDDSVNVELVNQVFEAPEEKALKDCACKGLGPCQCPPEEKQSEKISKQFTDLKYAGNACSCGGNCNC
nr:hypothetical protein [uncultured Marinifilum sp.]